MVKLLEKFQKNQVPYYSTGYTG